MKFNIPINQADIIVLLVLAVIFGFAVHVFIGFWKQPKAPVMKSDEIETLKAGSKITAIIDGMQCGMCEIHVKDAVRKALPKSSAVMANHTSGKVTFTLPYETTSKNLMTKLKETVEEEGYRVLHIGS